MASISMTVIENVDVYSGLHEHGNASLGQNGVLFLNCGGRSSPGWMVGVEATGAPRLRLY